MAITIQELTNLRLWLFLNSQIFDLISYFAWTKVYRQNNHYFNHMDRHRICEVHYEANTSIIGLKEADICLRKNWLFSSYGGSIYLVMYFANSNTTIVWLFHGLDIKSKVPSNVKSFAEVFISLKYFMVHLYLLLVGHLQADAKKKHI